MGGDTAHENGFKCSYLLRIKDRARCGKHRTTLGAGAPHKINILGGGGHRTYFVDEGKWGGDTAQQVIYSIGNNNHEEYLNLSETLKI